MDELFRKLGAGAKFNLKRFNNDNNKKNNIKKNKPVICKNQSVLKTSTYISSSSESDTDENEDDESDIDDDDDDEVDDDGESISASDNEDIQLMAGFDKKVKVNKKSKKLNLTKEQRMAKIKQEKVNQIRNKYHINVKGEDIANPCDTFQQLRDECKLSKQLIENIKEMDYDSPTPIQMQTIPIMMQKRDIMACAPTGSGKTASFILPILQMLHQPKALGFRVLVISPTRELAKQIHMDFKRLSKNIGFRIHYLDNAMNAMDKFGPKSSQKFDILISTPNRLIHLIKEDKSIINLKNIEWLVLDESDKLFEAGLSGFREQLAIIYKECDKAGIRRAMFSATFSYHVEQWCKMNLDNVIQISVGERNSAVTSVKQELLFVGSEAGKLVAIRDIINKGIRPPVLVFVESKNRAKQLYHELLYDKINIGVIHADCTGEQREKAMKDFRRGSTWIMICTDLMSRGIDFKGVNLVIIYDFPKTSVSYIHCIGYMLSKGLTLCIIGRSGRAGNSGKAVTFFTEDDAINLRSIANLMRQSGCIIPDYMLNISKPSKNTKRQISMNRSQREDITKLPRNDHSIKIKRKRKKKTIKKVK